jgi:hypothetical protein
MMMVLNESVTMDTKLDKTPAVLAREKNAVNNCNKTNKKTKKSDQN